MQVRNDMSKEQQSAPSQPETEQPVHDQPVASPGRRRFVTGLATGSVLMTVANRPAMAAWCTPSAWVSGNLSRPNGQVKSCGGRSHGFWRTQPKNWPSRYRPGTCKNGGPGTCTDYKGDGTPFHQGVGNGTGPFAGSRFGELTLMQVLWLQGNSDPHKLGGHFVAALLNSITIPNYGLSEATVIDMWFQLETQGFYLPPSGAATMTPEDVAEFLQNTFD